MKHTIFIIISVVLLFSCRQKVAKVPDKPSWLIEENKMVDILVDLRIADAATYSVQNQPPRNKTKDWYFIMKKHNVEDSIFRKSHEYYAGYPEAAEVIYEKVIDKLSEMQADNTDGQ